MPMRSTAWGWGALDFYQGTSDRGRCGGPVLLKISKRLGDFDMAKTSNKPPLTVVGPSTNGPPCKLGHRGMALWNAVMNAYRIEDIGGLEMLGQICAAVDRVEALHEAIDRDGAVIYDTRGKPKAHPAMREELALRSFIVRGLQRLGLTVEAIKPVGRPGSGGLGWLPSR
jgi:hypothetical protein